MNRFTLVVPAGLILALNVALPSARAQNNMNGPMNGGMNGPMNGGVNPTLGAPATALSARGDDKNSAAKAASVLLVDADNVAGLPDLVERAGAISLGVYAADLDKNPAARDALIDYVRSGGTVFLHTDAARVFGYRTVGAREGTARLAGQLYGRARAAVPFGTVPLLFDNSVPTRGAVRAPGVNRVFYTMRAGDDLVVDHPNGTPLLQVTDLASPTQQPLYAAAIAPFGAGWAVFTPDTIDTRRADGAAFARNLLKLVGESRYVGVPQADIVSGDGLLQSLSDAITGTNPALPALGMTNGVGNGMAGNGDDVPVAREGTMTDAPIARDNGMVMGNDNGTTAGADAVTDARPGAAMRADGPVLMLTRNEARSLGAALQDDPAGRGAAALALLRARVALLNGDGRVAAQQIELSARLAPVAGDVQFLNGVVALQNVVGGNGVNGVNGINRAQFANVAANAFAQAGGAAPYFAQAPGVAGVEYGDITGAQLNDLGAQLNRFSQVLSLEPPLTRIVGNGASAITIRYFAGDTALPFVELAAGKLANSAAFGWSLDGQEILLFPTPALYARYRAASGLNVQNTPLPPTAFGDVVDGRILMVSIPAGRPVVPLGNGQVRVLPLVSTSASLLARFEAYALLDGYVGDGGGRVPSWMALGLATLVETEVNGNANSIRYDEELRRLGGVGGLLTPAQFDSQLGESSLLAQAQATALMTYFYAQFGPGRVAETVQRLGAGQNVDDALMATTGFDQAGFFRAWSNAQFGNLLR